MQRGSGVNRNPVPFSGVRAMVTREELLRDVGELAHHNEKTYFG
jgi:hypothetical protein